ncbi:hypothetical protein D0962_10005 [Leptolyngbyaceae cyanobacterium CCMR0082]|uniref:Uncharacterized protein n=1 Tax=Adonisia turfae CCMR0082 TaxID=2304604 RepID=A0A6M0S465_9CYAN|nr:hypothetical protein [Adonisia turfae]NEZ63110.1 hypothetical protein [Adonisia turfae CCMR0082]
MTLFPTIVLGLLTGLIVIAFSGFTKLRKISRQLETKTKNLQKSINGIEIIHSSKGIQERLVLKSKRHNYFLRLKQELQADIDRLEEFEKQHVDQLSDKDREIYKEVRKLLTDWQEYQEKVEKYGASLKKRKSTLISEFRRDKEI